MLSKAGLLLWESNPYYSDAVSGAALIISVGLEQLTKERNDRLRRTLALAEMESLQKEQVAIESAGRPPAGSLSGTDQL